MILDGDTREFVERTGAVLEHMGIPRTVGRMLGLLMIAPGPLSLESMARVLKVSKPAVSNHVRLYREMGLIRRIRLPGDRRDYYEILPTSFEQVMETRLGHVEDMIELIDEGFGLTDHGNEHARRRLHHMRVFYRFLGDRMNDMMTQWERQKRDILAEN